MGRDDELATDVMDMLASNSLRSAASAKASSHERASGRFEAFLDGFSLHCGVHLHENDRQGIERLCRYGARGPLTLDEGAARAHVAGVADDEVRVGHRHLEDEAQPLLSSTIALGHDVRSYHARHAKQHRGAFMPQLDPIVAALAASVEMKDQKVTLPDAAVAQARTKLRALPASEKRRLATDLMAWSIKLERLAGNNAIAPRIVCAELALEVLGDQQAASDMFRAGGLGNDMTEVLGRKRDVRAPIDATKPAGMTVKATRGLKKR